VLEKGGENSENPSEILLTSRRRQLNSLSYANFMQGPLTGLPPSRLD